MSTARQFAVNQFTTMPQRFEDDLALYRLLGVESVEVCERKLSNDPGEAREQLAVVREKGFTVTSVQPKVHALFPDQMAATPEDPADRIGRLRMTIDRFTEAFPGLDVPFVTISGAAPGYDFRAAHRAARRFYPELADYAADRGVSIAFEMLHPVLMNSDTFICTLDEAVQLVEDVDRPNFGLVIDVWHLWQEIDIYERIANLGDHVFIAHISDWPVGGPRRMNDRAIPGTGRIDLSAMSDALDRAGYDGPYCLEILSDRDLSDSLWRADPGRVIEESRQAMKQACGT